MYRKQKIKVCKIIDLQLPKQTASMVRTRNNSIDLIAPYKYNMLLRLIQIP